jgi:hypothetical protein
MLTAVPNHERLTPAMCHYVDLIGKRIATH